MRFRSFHVFVGFVAVAAILAVPVQAGERKWSPYAGLVAKPGDERQIGELDLFAPLWQDDDSLLFLNLRGQGDDDANAEGNAGLGYRTILPGLLFGEDWIVGGYGYFDYRHSDDTDNDFLGGTLGIEALSEDWDVRMNGYIPEDDAKSAPDGNRIQIRGNLLRFRPGEERALYGVDGEVGWRLPLPEDSALWDTRVYVGGFHFDAEDASNVSGPRGRAEVRLHDLPLMPPGSRFTLGGEVQWDDVRGTQYFGLARVRVPFWGWGASASSRPTLTKLERRMTDPVVRDVDIVTGETLGRPELAVNPVTNQTVSRIYFAAAGGTGPGTKDRPDDLAGAVASAGADGVVVALAKNGDFDAQTDPAVLMDGQILMGGGSSIVLRGTSGDKGVLRAPGGRATIGDSVGGSADLVTLARDNSVIGLTLRDGSVAIMASGAFGNATIRDNRFLDNGTGIDLFNDTDTDFSLARIEGNRFSGNGEGLFVNVDDTGTISVDVLGNVFMENDVAVILDASDHDDGNGGIFANIVGNRFLMNSSTDIHTNTDDNDSDGNYNFEMVTNIVGNEFLGTGGSAIDFSFDSDSDADGGVIDFRSTIRDNRFEDVAGNAIELDVSDWDDEGLQIELDIVGNRFLSIASDAIDLDVADIDKDVAEDVIVDLIIRQNRFRGGSGDAIVVSVSDDAQLNGQILDNDIEGGVDGIDVSTSTSELPNTLSVRGNRIRNVSDTGIRIDSSGTGLAIDSSVPGAVENNVVTGSGVADTDITGTTGTIRVNGVDVP